MAENNDTRLNYLMLTILLVINEYRIISICTKMEQCLMCSSDDKAHDVNLPWTCLISAYAKEYAY